MVDDVTGGPAGVPSNPWVAFAIAASAIFLATLDTSVVVAAYAAIRGEFADASPTWLSWTLNAYTIVYAALLVPAGRLADLKGRRRVFIAGLALFTIASGLCAASPGIGSLVAARVVQAVGAALMTPAALALLLNAFTREQRAAVVGLFSAVAALAAAIGPALGSWIIANGSWRWVFLINLPLGLLGVLAALRLLAESSSPENEARLDWIGVLLLVLGAGLLALGIVRTEALGWTSPVVWSILAAGFAIIAVFVRWARHREHPALDLSLFDDTTFRVVNLATLAFSAAMSLMFLDVFLVLMDVWGYSQTLAGLAISPGPLIVLPVAIVSGRLAGRIGHRPLLVAGALLFALAQFTLFVALEPTPDFLGLWLPVQLTAGASIGMIMPSLAGAAVARLGPARYAVGGSVNNAMRQLGGALGASLAVAMVGGHAVTMADFKSAYLVLIGLALTTAALALRVDTHPRSLARAAATQ
ncbi:MAG: DHA2 family efflux MFS transporter permease subunit [Burkholderiaceae bacterium]